MTSAALASRFRAANQDENCSDLNLVVARAEQSIADIAGHYVGLQFALSPNTARVALPLADLERVVLGLCIAARSLLSPGGRLVVETRGVNDAQLGATVEAGEPEALARVIVRAEQLGQEPPPTPRSDSLPRQGELGYAQLEALLERVGGRLELMPLAENDLAYVAHLPHAISADESATRMAVAIAQDANVILLVEDEPQVQAVTTRILRAFGYTVITAHNERTAMAQAEQHGGAIGLVVSDLVLPGVSGKDLVRRLSTPCARARVLYISGYSPEHIGTLADGALFLRKPFTAQELLGVVRELLPEAGRAAR